MGVWSLGKRWDYWADWLLLLGLGPSKGLVGKCSLLGIQRC